jgi:NADPH:quinone reductase-like Zn-dependent oxidoreductase
MKACICPKYGPPSVLKIRDIEKPTPGENELLIKVFATTVNRTDIGFLRGKPSIVRLFTGLTKPQLAVTGTDFAGLVEAIGKNVTRFRTGDRVMGLGGMGIKSHAEYLTAAQTKPIILIPGKLNFEQAVACLEGAFYAASSIQYLKPKAGQKAMVNGATGAIGSSMIQILRHLGLDITATCRSEHSELVRSLGADKIIDYEQ